MLDAPGGGSAPARAAAIPSGGDAAHRARRARPVAAPRPGPAQGVPARRHQAALRGLGRPDRLLRLFGHAGRALSCSTCTARAARPGRRRTRSARRCRSTIICRIAPTTTAISTASTCRSMRSLQPARTSRRSAPRRRRPNCGAASPGLAKRTKALLHEGDALPVMVEDWRLGLEISVIHGAGGPHRRHARWRATRSARTCTSASSAQPASLSPPCSRACCAASGRALPSRRSPVNDVSAQTASDAGQRASGSSFYAAMRIMPRGQREAMFEIYSFCRAVDDIADEGRRHATSGSQQLQRWRDDIDAIYAGTAPPTPARARRKRCAPSISSARISSP